MSNRRIPHDSTVNRLKRSLELSGVLQFDQTNPVITDQTSPTCKKYQLLLRNLRDCYDPTSVATENEGLEKMLDIPKRANDALHLCMLHCRPVDLTISSVEGVNAVSMEVHHTSVSIR